jgi:hypothetical protein
MVGIERLRRSGAGDLESLRIGGGKRQKALEAMDR